MFEYPFRYWSFFILMWLSIGLVVIHPLLGIFVPVFFFVLLVKTSVDGLAKQHEDNMKFWFSDEVRPTKCAASAKPCVPRKNKSRNISRG